MGSTPRNGGEGTRREGIGAGRAGAGCSRKGAGLGPRQGFFWRAALDVGHQLRMVSGSPGGRRGESCGWEGCSGHPRPSGPRAPPQVSATKDSRRAPGPSSSTPQRSRCVPQTPATGVHVPGEPLRGPRRARLQSVSPAAARSSDLVPLRALSEVSLPEPPPHATRAGRGGKGVQTPAGEPSLACSSFCTSGGDGTRRARP